MEAAWARAAGARVQLSEQAVLDCAWGFVPGREGAASACDGGDAWAAVGHAVDAGGAVAADDYPYVGQDDFCRGASAPRAAKFAGYARVPRYDDAALREALASRGPVAVSMDASQDSFTFYSSGVYYDSACMSAPDDLDHAMLLVGYGTGASGDFWVVRNSWSTHWGDGGYFKVSTQSGGCGAASDAVYAVADEAAAAAARAAAAR
jgi:C1A family cysteine protease